MIISDAVKYVKDEYDKAQQNPLSEARAWDICHDKFHKAICGSIVNTDYLALHLGMYLANWGMYRGSSFLGNYNYREFIPIVEIVLEERYHCLFDIELKEYLNPAIDPITGKPKFEKLELLFELVGEISKKLAPLRVSSCVKRGDPVPQGDISSTLITKILLATLGCVPAYDTNFCKGMKAEKYCETFIGKGNDKGKSIKQLADFYDKNSAVFEPCRKGLKNLENSIDMYPQAKLIDTILFGHGLGLC